MSFSDLLPKPAVIAANLERRRLRSSFREIYRKFRAYTMLHEAKYVNNLELCFEFKEIAGLRRRMRSVARGNDAPAWPRCSAPSGSTFFSTASRDCRRRAKTSTARGDRVAKQYRLADLLQQLRRRGRGSGGGDEAVGRDFIFAGQGMVQRNLTALHASIAQSRCCGSTAIGTIPLASACENLYPHVAPGGIVIIDDYYNWDGCARAVNEFHSDSRHAQCGAKDSPVPRPGRLPDKAPAAERPRRTARRLPNE